LPRSRTGSRPGGKKAAAGITAEYLDAALADFSGYIAADELYDGPFCVLSIVDNRTFRRLTYEVLEHDPTQDDIRAFFRAFQAQLDARGKTLRGITTDGSALYPAVIAEVFPGARHQVCEFHVLKEITQSVLHAVARVRKKLKAQRPALPRGRPSKAGRAQARRAQRIDQRVADLFEHRHLFVQRHLTPAERKTLQRITRGLSHLRVLREIMEEVYRLFDRRCRTHTALAKLARLRRRAARFKRVGRTLAKLFTPNLEKALTFLDDRLLPATSNAVERGNRRYRKAQRSVYSVRTAEHIRQRIALDMHRDQRGTDRRGTLQLLHGVRAGKGGLQL
jgi:transposase-like protein